MTFYTHTHTHTHFFLPLQSCSSVLRSVHGSLPRSTPFFMNNWWCVSILHPIVSIWLAWADRRLFVAVKYCVTLWDVEPVEAETVAQTDSYIVCLNGETSEEKMWVDPDRMSWPPKEKTIWHGIRSSVFHRFPSLTICLSANGKWRGTLHLSRAVFCSSALEENLLCAWQLSTAINIICNMSERLLY